MRCNKFLALVLFVFLFSPVFVFSQGLKALLTVDNAIPCIEKTNALGSNLKLEVIDHKYFKLGYSQEHKQSAWVAYLLTKKMVLENNSVRSNKFKPDLKLTKSLSYPSDYKKSGFDKGHICSSADMSFSQEAQDLTFLMSNMSPQLHVFNAGKWKTLEEKVRDWAKENDSIIIIAGPILEGKLKTIGANKVSVPLKFYKIIIDISYPTFKAIGFVMPNEKLDKDIYYYSMSVDEVEKLIGLNFFPKYESNKLVQTLEKTINIQDWK